MDLVALGSKTAKNGFRNEEEVAEIFNDWRENDLAQAWLSKMKYIYDEIEDVRAVVLKNIKPKPKSDVNVQIKVFWKNGAINIENISVKLVSNSSGFNQIDKRWIAKYVEMWKIPEDVANILRRFTGEVLPNIENSRDPRRMFMDEFSKFEQDLLLNFIENNRILIVSDILKGRGEFSADWMLVVIRKDNKIESWALEEIGVVMNFFGGGKIKITSRGSFQIGKITVQRKGGDGGRDSAKMLQFKIDPSKLCKI